MSDRLIPAILRDRDTGTTDGWWRDRIGTYALDEGFGADGGGDQDAADHARIMRLPKVERALIRLAAAAQACVHTSPPHDAHAALAAVLNEIGAPDAERDAAHARAERAEVEMASGSFYQEKDIDALMARAERAEAARDAAQSDAAAARKRVQQLIADFNRQVDLECEQRAAYEAALSVMEADRNTVFERGVRLALEAAARGAK